MLEPRVSLQVLSNHITSIQWVKNVRMRDIQGEILRIALSILALG